MIDIHAHILPGIDDGAENMKSALEMAEIAAESGTMVMVATPHCMEFAERKNFWGQQLAKQVRDFRDALKRENIPLKIAPGMEIFGTPEVPRLLRERKMIGINGSDYPLIEFDFYNYADRATEILEKVLALNMRPIVAHPERYEYVQKDPRILNLWVDMGCLLQVNKGSLLGSFGRNEKYLAAELVERKFAFAVASDAHSPNIRTPRMDEVRDMLKEEFSEETANLLLKDNPLKILKNEKIFAEEPFWF